VAFLKSGTGTGPNLRLESNDEGHNRSRVPSGHAGTRAQNCSFKGRRLFVSWFSSSAADSSLVDKVGVIRERLTNFGLTDSGALSVVRETDAE